MKYIVWICLIILIVFILIYNLLKREQQQVKNAFASVDVILRKRYDLIPNLVEVVKGYATYEANIFEEITHIRQEAINASNENTTIQKDSELNHALKEILICSERYPALKANKNFLDLQRTLLRIEEELSAARRAYNSAVMEYNVSIDSFPSNIVAAMFSFQKKEMFEVSDDIREQIKIEM